MLPLLARFFPMPRMSYIPLLISRPTLSFLRTFMQLQTTNPNLCLLEQADYKECIHRGRLKRRIAAKALEIAKQGQAQKDGSNAPAASVPKE